MREIKVSGEILWDDLIKKTEGFSGADISNICREAALMPLKRRLEDKMDITQIVKDKGFFIR